VVLPETGSAAAAATAERLRSRVGAIVVPGTDARLSISAGVVSTVPSADETVDAILEKADRALYEAKRRGRNRVETYRESEDDRA